MKKKRSAEKRTTMITTIIRFMRISRGISLQQAGILNGCTGSAISHYEHGRMDLSPERLKHMVESYGYSMTEFDEYRAGKALPLSCIKDECIGLLDQIDETKLRAIYGVLTSFIS